ncbi:MAG TPA: cell division protein ZapA [Burkholderiales bacterium]|nr:cell division protein ZapA [Burkholderiales bacterium]
MSEAKPLQISIMGREFRVSCTDEERQGLLAAVDYLNRRMQEIRDQGRVIGVERIAIMAALNIAHEMLTTKVGDGFDMGEFKGRMHRMEAAIDRAMVEQDELF